ncbi:MAG: response regulator transcription factor [Bacteroidota bacterium]|nr:response regulator transcription factor [Bacteroidota bacterium]
MNSNGQKHISIFIADDHSLYVDTLVMALRQQQLLPIEVLGTASNGEQLINQLQFQKPDILLLDLNMPILNGLEVMPMVLEDFPDIDIIIVTKYDDPKFVKECLHVRRVSGYILKTSSFSELLEGISAVSEGQSYISRKLQLYPKNATEQDSASMFDESFMSRYNLTRRELEILGLIAQAKTNLEIAENLYISPQTVGAHRKNIMRKLNISSIAGLVRFAIENQVG